MLRKFIATIGVAAILLLACLYAYRTQSLACKCIVKTGEGKNVSANARLAGLHYEWDKPVGVFAGTVGQGSTIDIELSGRSHWMSMFSVRVVTEDQQTGGATIYPWTKKVIVEVKPVDESRSRHANYYSMLDLWEPTKGFTTDFQWDRLSGSVDYIDFSNVK